MAHRGYVVHKRDAFSSLGQPIDRPERSTKAPTSGSFRSAVPVPHRSGLINPRPSNGIRDFERPNDFEPLEYGKDVVVELESFPTGLPGQPVFWLAALMVRSRNLMSVLHRTVDPVSTNKRWLRLSKSFLGVFADLVKLWKRTFLNGALPRGRSVWAITAPNRGGRSTLILLELLPR